MGLMQQDIQERTEAMTWNAGVLYAWGKEKHEHNSVSTKVAYRINVGTFAAPINCNFLAVNNLSLFHFAVNLPADPTPVMPYLGDQFGDVYLISEHENYRMPNLLSSPSPDIYLPKILQLVHCRLITETY